MADKQELFGMITSSIPYEPLKTTSKELVDGHQASLEYNRFFSISFETFYHKEIHEIIKRNIKGHKVVALIFNEEGLRVDVLMLKEEKE